MTETTATLPTIFDLEYVPQEVAPYPPTPALADAMQSLTDDGDTFELADGRSLCLRLFPDEDASINDYEGDGQIEWTNDNDHGHVRPSNFDGSARVVKTERGSALWWMPPTKEIMGKAWDSETMQEEEARIFDLIEDGFTLVRLELRETLTDSAGNEHTVIVADAILGGVDKMYPDLVAELAGEIACNLPPVAPFRVLRDSPADQITTTDDLEEARRFAQDNGQGAYILDHTGRLVSAHG